MQSMDKPNGVYTPEDLKDMAEELDRGNVAGESVSDREHRAEEFFRHEKSRPAD